MIVVVESNFVLELAFGQEEAADAERIVELAERKVIELVIPSCALFEPYETVIRRSKKRKVTSQKLKDEIRQLSRSKIFASLAETSEVVLEALDESGQIEVQSLDTVIRRLLGCSVVTLLSGEIVRKALSARAQFELEPQDAIIFASVDEFLRTQGAGQKVFANKNHRDFLKPMIQAHLDRYSCKLLPKFSNARGFIESSVVGRA